jgi:hypothetical protein
MPLFSACNGATPAGKAPVEVPLRAPLEVVERSQNCLRELHRNSPGDCPAYGDHSIAAPILSEGHRPFYSFPRTAARSHNRTQQSAPQNTRRDHPRASHATTTVKLRKAHRCNDRLNPPFRLRTSGEGSTRDTTPTTAAAASIESSATPQTNSTMSVASSA